MTVLTSVDTPSGEIASGTIQAVATNVIVETHRALDAVAPRQFDAGDTHHSAP